MPDKTRRIATIGFGAMARSLQRSLKAGPSGYEVGAVLVRAEHVTDDALLQGVEQFHTVRDLIAWKPDLVVECAGHDAVKNHVSVLLRAGIDVVIISIGGLADAGLLEQLRVAADEGGGRLKLASGAVGGLDVLRSAKSAGLARVVYTGSKPPMAWKGTPADKQMDLAGLTKQVKIFEGTAAQAATTYPKNANVTAAIALAGIGFDDTEVTLIADPDASTNVHRIEAAGSFGSFSIVLENHPLPDNPKTSWLAALSVEQCVRQHFENVEL